MTEVSTWEAAITEIIDRLNFPEQYTGDGENDPPCRVACARAIDFCRLVSDAWPPPVRVENGQNGGIHIAGNGWHMHFWERETEVAP